MNFAKRLILVTAICSICGCASWIVRPQKVILLPEERIFTIPAGQKLDVLLDKKPMSMTFPYDMKLVSPTVLVRQEARLNDAMLGKIKADSDKKKTLGIVGAVLSFLTGILWVFRKKWWPNIKFNAEVK